MLFGVQLIDSIRQRYVGVIPGNKIYHAQRTLLMTKYIYKTMVKELVVEEEIL